jgi:UDP-glucose 4-epimerase
MVYWSKQIHFKMSSLMFLKSQQLNRYYHNITSNTLLVLEAMASNGVKTLIYSSTCATYGEPEKMPITEATPEVVTSRTETLRSEILYTCVFLIAKKNNFRLY